MYSQCIYVDREAAMTTDLGRWGNSLALRIPKALAEEAGLQEGDRVSLAVAADGALLVRPASRRYALRHLVSRITPRNRHPETNWGGPKGREPW